MPIVNSADCLIISVRRSTRGVGLMSKGVSSTGTSMKSRLFIVIMLALACCILASCGSASETKSSSKSSLFESASSASASIESTPATSANPRVYNAKYYVVSIPESMSGATFKYDEGRLGGSQSVGMSTSVMQNGKKVFEVTCISDDWGPQTDSGIANIGTPPSGSGFKVYVLAPRYNGESTDAINAKALEYSRYVALK